MRNQYDFKLVILLITWLRVYNESNYYMFVNYQKKIVKDLLRVN